MCDQLSLAYMNKTLWFKDYKTGKTTYPQQKVEFIEPCDRGDLNFYFKLFIYIGV